MNNQEQSLSISLVTLTNEGIQANGGSTAISLSDDGRLIPFSSAAENLFANDRNRSNDAFIYDRNSQSIELISIGINDSIANRSSDSVVISGDGLYAAFTSSASNLISDDTNGKSDIFLRDIQKGTTELISVALDGTSANDNSLLSVINDDGNYVAFESRASNLVADDTNGTKDVFLRDRITQTTELIGKGELRSISDDGQYVSFIPTDASGLSVGISIYDRSNEITELISILGFDSTPANDFIGGGILSGDGNYVVLESFASNLVANDTNEARDIFVYDRSNKTTELVSIGLDGAPADRNSSIGSSSISDDGRYVAFLSDATNLVADDTNERADIFVRDLVEKTTVKVDGDFLPKLSGDAQSLIFRSNLTDLVPNDTNRTGDVFLVDLSGNDGGTDDGSVIDDGGTDDGSVIDDGGTDDGSVIDDGVIDDGGVIDDNLSFNRFSTNLVYRFHNIKEGHHLYSMDNNEITTLSAQSATDENVSKTDMNALKYESPRFRVLTSDVDALTGEDLQDAGVVPVYHFFNSDTDAYLYTTDEKEINHVETLDNYSDLGIAYYAFESEPIGIRTIPMFRMLNSSTDSHFYSTSQGELSYAQNNLGSFEMENQGEAVFYVLDL